MGRHVATSAHIRTNVALFSSMRPLLHAAASGARERRRRCQFHPSSPSCHLGEEMAIIRPQALAIVHSRTASGKQLTPSSCLFSPRREGGHQEDHECI